MKSKDILNLVIAKVESIKNQIEIDYSKGKISHSEKNHSLFYTDQLKYEVQRVLGSMTHPND